MRNPIRGLNLNFEMIDQVAGGLQAASRINKAYRNTRQRALAMQQQKNPPPSPESVPMQSGEQPQQPSVADSPQKNNNMIDRPRKNRPRTPEPEQIQQVKQELIPVLNNQTNADAQANNPEDKKSTKRRNNPFRLLSDDNTLSFLGEVLSSITPLVPQDGSRGAGNTFEKVNAYLNAYRGLNSTFGKARSSGINDSDLANTLFHIKPLMNTAKQTQIDKLIQIYSILKG